MPAQKPGKSKQDYCTPEEFLTELKTFLGISEFDIDLAASKENSICGPHRFYGEDDDSLKQPWVVPGWGFCNPPFADIAPWVQRAWEQSQLGAKVAMLIPAGVGANWWRDYVADKAEVLLLNGRLCFIKDWATTIDPASLKPGKGPERFYTSPPLYPKDCCLLLYYRRPEDALGVRRGSRVWDWRKWRT